MTDKDIIKALEDALAMGDSPIGEHWGVLISKAKVRSALDLINRQKAEIERLEDDNQFLQDRRFKELSEVRDIAIKEFAERLKAEIKDSTHMIGIFAEIDNLVKETVGERE